MDARKSGGSRKERVFLYKDKNVTDFPKYFQFIQEIIMLLCYNITMLRNEWKGEGKMRCLKKGIAAIIATTLCISVFSVNGGRVKAADAERTVKLQLENASVFHDTDGDGLGEFEGWGTSLCWWANRVGYDEALTSQAARLFFSDEGLDMNIGRYNVGGGDLVGEVKRLSANPKAVFYDLETAGRIPKYEGTKMFPSTNAEMSSVTYTVSDPDFGINRGDRVGEFRMIGWVNGVNDEIGSGDSLHYTVNVKEKANYTVKLLLTLTGSNPDRNAAIKVNGTDYTVSTEEINKNIIASGNNHVLYLVTFRNVAMNAGDNTLDVGGIKIKDSDSSWALDFVKMAVIKSGEEGVNSNPEFLHSAHITRSDSAVPGYATDVTKIVITEQKPLSWYQENFARVDETCGYAWNYNWDADKNQMAVLKAAAKSSGKDFIAEAFSNSPPYFMTNSGCSSGAVNSSKDNLRPDSYNAFAAYMADVIEHWNKEGVITFQSTDPMNEPYTNYWGANSNKQEGCHFDQGESQSKIIVALDKELKKKGIDIIISGTDETSIDTQISSYNKLSEEAKKVISRIDTHTYGGSKRAELSTLAKNEGKNLWMSEVDGTYTAGTNAGEMAAALGLAQTMVKDVNELQSTAWILWNAIDAHIDSEMADSSTVDYKDRAALNQTINMNKGYWGLAFADHDKKEIILTKKYYAYGQFSRYIRPGYTIISSDENTLAAYDPKGKKVVVVALNTAGKDQMWKFDLGEFQAVGDEITAIRTSGSLSDGENWADVTKTAGITVDKQNRSFQAVMKANSITTFIADVEEESDPNTDPDPVKKLPYTDVKESDWWYQAVYDNYVAGSMTGKDKTTFAPTENLVRAQFASILWKMNGKPGMVYTNLFEDVVKDQWFTDCVLWAADKEIVTGYSNTKNFGPNDNVTRAQVATMLYRYAKSKGYTVETDGSYEGFPDAGEVQEFAIDAMRWAVGSGIISGKTLDGSPESKKYLQPQGNSSRAECAQMVQRFMELYKK